MGRCPARWLRPTRSDRSRRQLASRRGPAAPIKQAVGDVVEDAEPVQQEELLEDEAQPPGPQARELVVGHVRGVLPGDADLAAGGPLQGAHDVQEGALSRPRWTDDRDELAGVHAETHPGEGHDRRVAGVLLDDVDQLENRSRGSSLGKGPGGGHGHDEGTSTRVPTVMPDPLIWTRVLL